MREGKCVKDQIVYGIVTITDKGDCFRHEVPANMDASKCPQKAFSVERPSYALINFLEWQRC